MNMKFTIIVWYILPVVCVINRIDASRVKRCAIPPVLAQITPTESAVVAQIQQTDATVKQRLQPVYDNFISLSQSITASVDNLTQTLNECAWNQTQSIVSNSVYAPIRSCIDYNVNMINSTLQSMQDTATNQVTNFINNYIQLRSQCFLLTTTNATNVCLQRTSGQLASNATMVNSGLKTYISKGHQIIINYQNSISSCYPNNVMLVISALQGQIINPLKCGINLSTLDINFALQRYTNAVNQLGFGIQTHSNNVSIQFDSLQQSFNASLKTQMINVRAFLDSITQCGRNQGVNVTVSIVSPILNCSQDTYNNLMVSVLNGTSNLNSSVTQVLASTVLVKAICMNFTSISQQIDCLMTGAYNFDVNSTSLISKIDAIAQSTFGLGNSSENNLVACFANNKASVLMAAQSLGVDLARCNQSVLIDFLALTLDSYNRIANQSNTLLGNSIDSALSSFQNITNLYTTSFNDSMSNLENLMNTIRQCGQSQGILNVPMSTFAPISNCITLSNDVLQAYITIWNTTLINSISSASLLNNIQVQRDSCLMLATLSAKTDCLNSTILTYQNSVKKIVSDLNSLMITANTTTDNFAEVLETCYLNNMGSVLQAVKDMGINLNQCTNVPTLPPTTTTTPITNINVALQRFDAIVTDANGLIQSNSLAYQNQLEILLGDYRLNLDSVKAYIVSLITNVQRCAASFGFSNLPTSLFSGFSTCVNQADASVQTLIGTWNSTLTTTLTGANQKVQIEKNLCLIKTTGVIQCLNTVAEAYANNVPGLINNLNNITTVAFNTLQIYKGVLTSCYSSNFNSLVTIAKNVGIDLLKCTNITPILNSSVLPIDPVLIALGNFNGTVFNANLLLDNGLGSALNTIDNLLLSYSAVLKNVNLTYETFYQSVMQCIQKLGVRNVPESIFDPITKCISGTNLIVQSFIPVWKAGFVNTTDLTIRNVEEEKLACLNLPTASARAACLDYTAQMYNDNIPVVLRVYNATLMKALSDINSYADALSVCYSNGYTSVMNLVTGYGINMNYCRAPTSTTTPSTHFSFTTKSTKPIDISSTLNSFNLAFDQANQLIQSRFHNANEALQIISQNYISALNNAKYQLSRFKQNVAYCAREQGYYYVPSGIFEPISRCIQSTDTSVQEVITSSNTTFTNKILGDRQNVLEEKARCLAASSVSSMVVCLNDLAKSYSDASKVVVNYFNSALRQVLDEVNRYSEIMGSCYRNGFYPVLNLARNHGLDLKKCMLN